MTQVRTNSALPMRSPVHPDKPRRVSFVARLVTLAMMTGALLLVTVAVLWLTGLVGLFQVPSNAMAPTIIGGDHVLMERITYRQNKPRRGDVIVFKTDGIPGLRPGMTFAQRIVGEPGERVRIGTDGSLYINDVQLAITVWDKPVTYTQASKPAEVTVPEDAYYTLGDNSANSMDSRQWGFVPLANVQGRIVYCCWPMDRRGVIE